MVEEPDPAKARNGDFFFIETKGATLEEISRAFDGEDAVEEVKVRALVGKRSRSSRM